MKTGSFVLALLAMFVCGIVVGCWWPPCCSAGVWKYIFGRKTDTPLIIHFTSEDESVRFLALNMYFHRGKNNSDIGRKAITAVVFNRLKDHAHYWGPKSVKGIITFGYKPGWSGCSFSWYCDGRNDVPANPQMFAHDLVLAKRWLAEYQHGTFSDPTGGATWFLYRGSQYPKRWPALIHTGTYGMYSFYKF